MATYTTTAPCDNSSLANFKAWAQAISTALATLGWTQTSDTGQVNWSTIASVPSGYVYEVWKSTDALSTSLPIFLRVNYGSSSTAVQIQMFVGTGSNGSGTITGQTPSTTPWALCSLTTNNGATLYPCYFSGDGGNFRMYMWSSTTAIRGVVFGIERSVNSAGSATADYFTVLQTQKNNNTSFQGQQSIAASSVGSACNGILGFALTSIPGTGAAGANVAAFPVFPLPGVLGNPMIGFMTVASADTVDGAIVTVASLYGSSHLFVSVVAASISQGIGQRSSSSSSMSLLMRFE